jgi:hypothetical protein
VVTLFVSRLTPPPPLEVQEMVARLRSPEGNDAVYSIKPDDSEVDSQGIRYPFGDFRRETDTKQP